jgi:hypothetical protein
MTTQEEINRIKRHSTEEQRIKPEPILLHESGYYLAIALVLFGMWLQLITRG